MMRLATVYFIDLLVISTTALSVPAGLRPAKKVGDPKEQIVPEPQQVLRFDHFILTKY